MATRERPKERGNRIARETLGRLAQEFRDARRDRGLSLRSVAVAAGVGTTTVWRFERRAARSVSATLIARLLAVVGLDLVARAYPGGSPLRDAGHVRLLERFRRQLHPSLIWSTEVPFPHPGDQRGWDGAVKGASWRYGVEGETGPRDAQALGRRLELKRRDGAVDGVLLILPDTRGVREFLAAAGPILVSLFPVPGRRALQALRLGQDPGGSAIIVVP